MPLQIHGNVQTVDTLIRANAVGIKRPKAIRFAQGILSPGAYIDNRVLKSHPKQWGPVVSDVRCLVGRLLRQYKDDRIVLASVASGGDALASVVAWQQDLSHVSVRKQAKDHGAQKGLVDGDEEVLKGAKVFLIEDMSSSFTSCLNAMKPLEAAGAQVVETILINTWNLPEFQRNIEGHSVHALCTGEMILERVVELGSIDREHEQIMRRWLLHPEDESWAGDPAWLIPG